MTGAITMTIWTATDIGSVEYARLIADAMTDGGWAPSRMGAYEPLRQQFSLNEFERLWKQSDRDPSASRDIHIRVAPPIAGHVGITWRRAADADFNTAYLRLPNDSLSGDGFHRMLRLGEAVYVALKSTYARLYTQPEFQAEHFSRSERKLLGVRFGPAIPGVYSLNIFGPPIVRFFGDALFETCPAYNKWRLPEGSWVIQIGESPADWALPETRDMKERVKRHLGLDAFFDIDQPDRRIRTPDGGWTRFA
jgi:hypothetical protein